MRSILSDARVEYFETIQFDTPAIRHGKVLRKGGKYIDELSKIIYHE